MCIFSGEGFTPVHEFVGFMEVWNLYESDFRNGRAVDEGCEEWRVRSERCEVYALDEGVLGWRRYLAMQYSDAVRHVGARVEVWGWVWRVEVEDQVLETNRSRGGPSVRRETGAPLPPPQLPIRIEQLSTCFGRNTHTCVYSLFNCVLTYSRCNYS